MYYWLIAGWKEIQLYFANSWLVNSKLETVCTSWFSGKYVDTFRRYPRVIASLDKISAAGLVMLVDKENTHVEWTAGN